MGATRDRGESMAKVASYSVAPGLYFADTAAVREALQALRTNPLLRYATGFDAGGHEIAGIYKAQEDSLRVDRATELGVRPTATSSRHEQVSITTSGNRLPSSRVFATGQ